MSVKILALLMCKGSLESKANIMFDTILGRAGMNLEKDSFSIGSSRLKRACRKLAYFSEILPKKLRSKFQSEIDIEINQTNQPGKPIKIQKQQESE